MHDMATRYVWGSSPRMRGALYPLVGIVSRRRIIPAYAGSTTPPLPPVPMRADHPRVCGEHSVGITATDHHTGSSPRMRGAHQAKDRSCCVVLGSSPRMRGAPRRVLALQALGGIIPAYAGST